jgi:hypothetical protein
MAKNKKGSFDWTDDKLKRLYKLKKTDGDSWVNIGAKLGTSGDSARRKFSRVNWSTVFTDVADVAPTPRNKKWEQKEMIRFYSYLESEKSYSFIAEKLGRSEEAVSKKAQKTDWVAWHTATFMETEKGKEVAVTTKEDAISNLVESMVSLSRHTYIRISDMTKNTFVEKVSYDDGDLPIPFSEIKDLAIQRLDAEGLGNEAHVTFGEGTYLVVGDSHGKHTKRKMFSLLKKVNQILDVDQIIHVGHLLDDDDDISFKWGDFKNLTILAHGSELQTVHKKRNSHNFSYDVVKHGITLGNDLTVYNQDKIRDYVRSSIRLLDNELFGGKIIVNCHRMESVSKACNDSSHYAISPGGLCEPHVVRTIKQIDWKDHSPTKIAYTNGFQIYRNREIQSKYWNQGILVVHVDANGEHTVIPCPIKTKNDEYYTSYFDKIISARGSHNPTKKIFVHADMHSPSHDANILDIQEQICEDYKPDVLVNIGDAFDAAAISHHDIDKGIVIFGDFLEEAAKTNYIMKRMSNWADECHAIVGNHERFIQDFVKKFPQLSSILDFKFVCDLEELGYKMTPLKNVLKIGSAKFLHGDVIVYNQTGSKLEKISRAYGHDTFIGHIHYPSIRFGCYSVGFAGKMDQGYNEAEVSCWIHGLGFCNQYKGLSWPTTVAIFNNKLVINGKTYEPKDPASWELQDFKARIVYDVENKKSNS